jgi:hypothetical protein
MPRRVRAMVLCAGAGTGNAAKGCGAGLCGGSRGVSVRLGDVIQALGEYIKSKS